MANKTALERAWEEIERLADRLEGEGYKELGARDFLYKEKRLSESAPEDAFLISKFWTDSLENELAAATGYSPHAIALDEREASVFVGGESYEGTGWPIPKGVKVPIYTVSKLPILRAAPPRGDNPTTQKGES